MAGDQDFPALGTSLRDGASAVARAAGALVPHGGKVVGTLIGSIIPGQRMNRLEAYVSLLKEKLENLTEEQEKIIASSPEHIDLFEEGAFRAARATQAEKIRRISFIVAVGMTKGTADAVAQKRLLTIFSDLDEQDIIVLYWYVVRNRMEGGQYAIDHQHLFSFDALPVSQWSSRQDRENDALRKAIDNKLIRYGLLEMRDEPRPEGMTPRQAEHITQLGLLMLRTAELIDNETNNSGTLFE